VTPSVRVGFPVVFASGEVRPGLEPAGGVHWDFNDYFGVYSYVGIVYSVQATYDPALLVSIGLRSRF
jgi:hypothetical protein